MNIILTEEQERKLKIKDERVDFYFKVENEVVDNCTVFSSPHEKLLHMVLARFCNNNKVAFPSYSTLSELCICSKSTIIRTMNSLEKKGLINKIRRVGKTEINDTNLYTLNNINEYSTKKIDDKGSVSETLGVVSERHQGSVTVTPNKELLIKNNIKKKNTTTTPNIISSPKKNSSSSLYDFLDLEEFSKINHVTKKNIRKNFKDLSIDNLREVYKQTESVISKGHGNSFDAILYRGLNGEWNFTTYDKNSSKVLNKNLNENTELEPEKLTWLNHFSGIKADKELFHFIKKSIVNVPLLILNQNRSKLSKMNLFEFRNHVSFLGKQDYSEIS